MANYSIYLHIPFCYHRCAYCDFNTYAGLNELIPAYTQSLREEIAWVGSSTTKPLPVHTIFFGGGTPSLLPVRHIAEVLETLSDYFALSSEVEITLECNPGTVSFSYLRSLRNTGVNRLSLGVQSANPIELHLLERQHDYLDVINAVKWARKAGFDNLNLDLIYGLPGQPIDRWQHTLQLALQLFPEHFSLYALTIEHGTPFAHWSSRGLIPQPDPDQAADMYEWAAEQLSSNGYTHYEISNWAATRSEKIMQCQHNLQYWRNLSYLGFGAGAHGYAAGCRTVNVLAPAAYIERLEKAKRDDQKTFPVSPATQSVSPVDRETEISEMMMMGLRLVTEGVSERVFYERFGQSLFDVFKPQIERMVRLGLLEWQDKNGGRLRLSQKGYLLGNQVFVEFV